MSEPLKILFEFEYEGKTFIIMENDRYLEIAVVLINYDKVEKNIIK